MIFYRRDFGWSKMYHPVISTVFLFIFGNLNGILSQHGAVKFHRRKGKFLAGMHQDSGQSEDRIAPGKQKFRFVWEF